MGPLHPQQGQATTLGTDASEFKFWYSATKANAIALLCTLTRATDVPVYWPILLIYFLTLFGLTMRRQIQYVFVFKRLQSG